MSESPNSKLKSAIPRSTADERAVYDRLLLALSSYHGVPSKKEIELVSGSESERLLYKVIETNQGLVRNRALLALAYWPSVEGLETVRLELEADSTQESMQHALIVSLADYGAIASPLLQELLKSSDLQIRKTAAYALSKMNSSEPKSDGKNRSVIR